MESNADLCGTLYHSTLRWAISRNATPFMHTLCYSTLPWAIWRNAIPFVYRIANECLAIRNWASPFHYFMFQLDMQGATGPFIIWLDYSYLGCSVSWRKTKPSIIWSCHSFISYSILQLIFKLALYLLIYLKSLYFWWWRPPIYSVLGLWSLVCRHPSH